LTGINLVEAVIMTKITMREGLTTGSHPNGHLRVPGSTQGQVTELIAITIVTETESNLTLDLKIGVQFRIVMRHMIGYPTTLDRHTLARGLHLEAIVTTTMREMKIGPAIGRDLHVSTDLKRGEKNVGTVKRILKNQRARPAMLSSLKKARCWMKQRAKRRLTILTSLAHLRRKW